VEAQLPSHLFFFLPVRLRLRSALAVPVVLRRLGVRKVDLLKSFLMVAVKVMALMLALLLLPVRVVQVPVRVATKAEWGKSY
jgi:hypothetical protein